MSLEDFPTIIPGPKPAPKPPVDIQIPPGLSPIIPPDRSFLPSFGQVIPGTYYIAAALPGGVHNPANPLPELLLESLGFHFTPGAYPVPIRAGLGALSWLAPAPVGLVPPTFYGLPENWFGGFTPEETIDLLTGQAAVDDAKRKKELLTLAELSAKIHQLEANPNIATDQELAAASMVAKKLGELHISADDANFYSLANSTDALLLKHELDRRGEQRTAAVDALAVELNAVGGLIGVRLPSGFVELSKAELRRLQQEWIDEIAAFLPPDP